MFFTLYYIHIIFTAWLMVYTFENTNALEHIFMCFAWCSLFWSDPVNF